MNFSPPGKCKQNGKNKINIILGINNKFDIAVDIAAHAV
jgi:hypothetical protein